MPPFSLEHPYLFTLIVLTMCGTLASIARSIFHANDDAE